MDFSEFETARGGIWRICAVIDYATKDCLAATVTPTSRGADPLTCLLRAVDEAKPVLDLDDLRALTVGRRTWSTPRTSSSARFPHPSQ
jgi:putative transposase